MDFADFDLKAASETGAWLHLEHDDYGPLYVQVDDGVGKEPTDRPCRVHLKGIGSDAVMSVIREAERLEMVYNARMARARDNEADKIASKYQEATQDCMRRLMVAAVDDFENIMARGEELAATRDNVLKICGPGTTFFAQVRDAIMERKRFLTNAASD